jgi:hypothetical protein
VRGRVGLPAVLMRVTGSRAPGGRSPRWCEKRNLYVAQRMRWTPPTRPLSARTRQTVGSCRLRLRFLRAGIAMQTNATLFLELTGRALA